MWLQVKIRYFFWACCLVGASAVAYLFEPSALERRGILEFDSERVMPGSILVSFPSHPLAVRISKEGEIVRTWGSLDLDERGFNQAELLPNGEMLVIAKEAWLRKLDETGSTLWVKEGTFHHDIAPAGEGEFWVIKRRMSSLEHSPDLVFADDYLGRYSESGEQLETVELSPLLLPLVSKMAMDSAVEYEPKEYSIRALDDSPVDLFHLNAVVVVPQRLRDKLGGDLLLCSKYLDALVLVDLASGTVAKTFGRDFLDGPHDPSFTTDDTLLVFDNGLKRGWPQVIEIDLRSDEPIWEYRGGDASQKYFPLSPTRGSAQRLPNGNTLIGSARSAIVFEVTRAGEVVWILDLSRSNELAKLGIEDPRFYRAVHY